MPDPFESYFAFCKRRPLGKQPDVSRFPAPFSSGLPSPEKTSGPVDSGGRFPEIYSGSRTMSDSPEFNGMDPIDREILALRHFEHLSNDETAQVLGLTKSAASNRYIRALKRLKEILSAIPGLVALIQSTRTSNWTAGRSPGFFTSSKDSISLISNSAFQARWNSRLHQPNPEHLHQRIPRAQHIPCITGKREPFP